MNHRSQTKKYSSSGGSSTEGASEIVIWSPDGMLESVFCEIIKYRRVWLKCNRTTLKTEAKPLPRQSEPAEELTRRRLGLKNYTTGIGAGGSHTWNPKQTISSTLLEPALNKLSNSEGAAVTWKPHLSPPSPFPQWARPWTGDSDSILKRSWQSKKEKLLRTLPPK